MYCEQWEVFRYYFDSNLVVNIDPLFLNDLVLDLLVNIDPDLLATLTQSPLWTRSVRQYWPDDCTVWSESGWQYWLSCSNVQDLLVNIDPDLLETLIQSPLWTRSGRQYWPVDCTAWSESGWQYWHSCPYDQDHLGNTDSDIVGNIDPVAFMTRIWMALLSLWPSCLYGHDLDVKPEFYNNQDPAGNND